MADDPVLRVVRLSPGARLPERASAGAIGYDLRASTPARVPARGRVLVSTGLAIALPPGTYGRVAPRSGLASKKCVDVGAGVIDPDYRGELHILLVNDADRDFFVEIGDRVAQLIVERAATPPVVETDRLDDTARGSDGFGSTLLN